MAADASYYKGKVIEDVGDTGANAQFELVLPVDATGGHFTATFGGATTGNVAWPSLASVLRAALEALGTVQSGNVAVTPGVRGYIVEFVGEFANTPLTEGVLSADGSGLTPSAGTIAVATKQAGRAVFLTPTRINAEWDAHTNLHGDLVLQYLETRAAAIWSFIGFAWPQINQQTGDEHRAYDSQYLHLKSMYDLTLQEIDRRLIGLESDGSAAVGQPMFGTLTHETPSGRDWPFGHGCAVRRGC